jgi:hypothetical protein
MLVTIKSHEWLSGDVYSASRVYLDAGRLSIYTESGKLVYPFQAGKLCLEILHKSGNVLHLDADDAIRLQIEGELTIYSIRNGTLVITSPKHEFFHIEASSLVLEEGERIVEEEEKEEEESELEGRLA